MLVVIKIKEMNKILHLLSILLIVFMSCKGDKPIISEKEKEGERDVIIPKKDSPFDINGRLKLVGTNIVNEKGAAIQLRGMSTHGLQYRGNCYNEQSLNLLMHDWGVDVLRISMYIQEGGYEKEPVYFTKFVDDLVEKCYKEGVYTLIDWHMLDPGDPNYNTERAKVFFEHVSKKHADKGNVLYEICNEPNNKQYEVTWSMIKNYADQIVPIIRKNDPKSIIIVGTPENASRPDLVIGNALSYDNIMYTMHFYAADSWQSNHQGRRMGYVSKAIENGIPVFVTEFGTQDGWGDGANDFVMSAKWLKFMEERKISWCNWNYSDSPLTGAAWKTGTCPNGPWTDDNLKEAGKWIRTQLSTPADNWTGTYLAWNWEYNLGSGTGTGTILNPTSSAQVSESKKDAPGFLPYPTIGTARALVAANAGAGFNLNNSILTLGASNGTVPNKFSLYDIAGSSTLVNVSFKLSFNNSTQGTAILAIGGSDGNLFKNNDAYSNNKQNGLFTAIRFLVGTNSTNAQYRYADGSSYFHRSHDVDLFSRSGDLNFEIYCNNTSNSRVYNRNGVSHTLPASSLHLYVNNIQVKYSGSADIASSGELFPYMPIDAFMVSGASSAGNTLNFSVSNIKIKSLIGN